MLGRRRKPRQRFLFAWLLNQKFRKGVFFRMHQTVRSLFGNGSDTSLMPRMANATVTSCLPLAQANFGTNKDNGNENTKQSNLTRNLDNDKENAKKGSCQIVSLISFDEELNSLCNQSDTEFSQHAAVALSRNSSLEQLLRADIPTVGAPPDQSRWDMTQVVQLPFTLASTNCIPVKSCSFLSDGLEHMWLLPESWILAARQKLAEGTKELEIPTSAGALFLSKKQNKAINALKWLDKFTSKCSKSPHLNLGSKNKGLVLNDTAISAGFQHFIMTWNLTNVAEINIAAFQIFCFHNFPQQTDSFNCGPCVVIALEEMALFGCVKHTAEDSEAVWIALLQVLLQNDCNNATS
ncbi:hypothetical protein BJ741DRAFT_679071 [Chytriomyces cf. hyalinus JEL632]|nr:hypothetical protein BJ741DRAFT_679071 [Chytriomyces cf. hyalinus JEL632]